MMSKTPSPNLVTSFFASTGPMPLIMPLPRYFSMPSREVRRGWLWRVSARNWRPCCGSRTQSPVAVQPLAAVDGGQRAEHGDEVALAAHLDAQHGEPVLLVEERDALDETFNAFHASG